MKIKDFKVGDKVAILGENKGISLTTVTKVGRKYVYIGTGWSEEKFEATDENYLRQVKNWGYRDILFHTEADLMAHIRYKKLNRWLFDLASRHRYTLEQLDAVVKILNPHGEYDYEIKAGR